MLAFISLHSQETKDSRKDWRETPLLGETKKNRFMMAKHDSKSLFGRGLANTIANVLLNQMVVRRHNMSRATALECSPLSRCILKKRKIRGKIGGKRRFWVKPRRTDLWWQNMIQNRCLEEDWRKHFRMSKNEFMKLVDSYRNGSQCSVYMIPV